MGVRDALPARDAERALAAAGSSGMTRRDPLTGLGNRLALSEDLAALDARTQRYGRSYCIALCELDRSQRPHGAQSDVAGDDALTAAARALRQECHGTVFAYRAGGEEIIVVLPDRTIPSARVVLERMRRAVGSLSLRPSGDAAAGILTMSVGLASRDNRWGASSRDVLARARAALGGADARGGDCVVVDAGSIIRTPDAGQAPLDVPLRRFAAREPAAARRLRAPGPRDADTEPATAASRRFPDARSRG